MNPPHEEAERGLSGTSEPGKGGQPIRILFMATTLTMGGAEKIFESLITGLDRRRFDVEVATLRDPGRVGEMIAGNGIPLRHGWTGRKRFDPAMIPKLHAWINDRRFEVVYFLDHPHAIFHGTIASWATRVRVRLMPVHTTGRWGGKKSVPRSVRLFFPWIDAVIAIADAQRSYLIEQESIPPEKLVVIPNGIPSEAPDAAERGARRAEMRSELGLASEDQVAMVLAVLRPEKNHELLLRAAARLREANRRLVLLFVGDGPRRGFLESEVVRLGLESSVRFLGHQSDGRRFWAAADVALLVSHPRVETLPLSLLEGMDFGLPVVATDVGAMREIVRPGKNGELIAPGDEEALAERLGAILSDPEKARAYANRSQEIVREKYTSQEMVRRTERLIDEFWCRGQASRMP